jgi:hypothetical protein
MTDTLELFSRIESAAQDGAFGQNPRPLPTDAQCNSGNYKVGRVEAFGLNLAIEQPRNSYRTGIDKKTGGRWTTRLAAHYGYISGTKGADGDPVDVFIGFYPQSEYAWVINQYVDGQWDEHKVCLCFPDGVYAQRAYLDSYEKGWPGLESIVKVSLTQLKWWLKNGNLTKPLRPEHLPYDGYENMNQRITWDSAANPHQMGVEMLLYKIRQADGNNPLLLDSVSMADILEEADEILVFDALVSTSAALERKMNALMAVMTRAGGDIKPVVMQISDPFKQSGVAQVAVVYELSDGQTVSIFFHNPDVTPQKMAPGDSLISWRWMLNKRDLTILVAPERGKDLNVREVATRIMKLAAKNSPAFQRANTKRVENMAAIEAIKGEIVVLEKELADAQHELEVARIEAEDLASKPKEPHYSEQIIDELAATFGWQKKSQSSAEKDIGGGATGGELNPEGSRIVHAVFDETGRYLALQVGFENIFDMDCRDKDIKAAAKEFDDKVNAWAESTQYQPKPTQTNEQENQQTEVTQETETAGTEVDPSQTHIDTLQAIVDGQHDGEDLSALLDKIDQAAQALIDAGLAEQYDELIGKAAEHWAALDQKANG